jgi:hypothetical protein
MYHIRCIYAVGRVVGTYFRLFPLFFFLSLNIDSYLYLRTPISLLISTLSISLPGVFVRAKGSECFVCSRLHNHPDAGHLLPRSSFSTNFNGHGSHLTDSIDLLELIYTHTY